jgi:rhamnogalacturonyl hydrolase YesR
MMECGRCLALVLVAWPVLITADEVKRPQAAIYYPGAAYMTRVSGAMAGPQKTAPADALPGKQEIFSILQKVNSYQLAHPIGDAWQTADLTVDQARLPWRRATWYTGVMAVWKATRDPSFLEQAVRYGRVSHWGVGEEQLGANRLFPVQVWVEVYFAKKDRAMIEPAIKWLATSDPLTPAGQKRWYLDAPRSPREPPVPYADSLYGASALAMLAKATGDRKYIDIMNAFFDDVTGELFDKESGLFYRDTHFIGQRTANGKKILWSRGNGWVFAGIPRILDYLPKNDPSRQRYLEIFRRQAAALIKRQGADGLWRGNLDDPEQFPNPETSGTGFFCFGLAWGINHGVLNRAEHLPAVEKAWKGLTQCLSPEGKVLWGQLPGDQPTQVRQDDTHEYVTGAFLLAGSELYKLTRKK